LIVSDVHIQLSLFSHRQGNAHLPRPRTLKIQLAGGLRQGWHEVQGSILHLPRAHDLRTDRTTCTKCALNTSLLIF